MQSGWRWAIRSNEETGLNQKLAECVAFNMILSNSVHQNGFRNLITYTNDRFNDASCTVARKDLMRLYRETIHKLQSMFDSADAISAPTDVWTSENSEPYTSFTFSFIESLWQFCSRCIACVEIDGRHTGEELSKLDFKKETEFIIEKRSGWYSLVWQVMRLSIFSFHRPRRMYI